MKWFLNAAYVAVLTLLSPVIIYRSLRHGRYRRGWREKLFGQLPTSTKDRRVIWFHAVSVGEVLQLQKLVERFMADSTDAWQVLVTTSTDTGFDLAVQRFPEAHVTWFPLDFSWAVRRAVQRVRPAALVLVELELWPNLLAECHRRDVSTAIVNARVSDRSFRGYLKLRPLLRSTFGQFRLVAAQTAEYAERLVQLGVPRDRVHVTGSIKFDGVMTDRANAQTDDLRRLFGLTAEQTVLVAGSTQDPEEQATLEAWMQLRESFPSLRLILVPRHRERFNAVAELVRQSGATLVRRSELDPQTDVLDDAVLLLDTIGELSACWGLADVAIVGGSFGSRGGQNMLEPAAYGAAVLFGPNTWNFRDIVQMLQQADAAITVPTLAQLKPTIESLLSDHVTRRRLGSSASRIVRGQQGSLQMTVDLLLQTVSTDRVGPSSEHVSRHAA